MSVMRKHCEMSSDCKTARVLRSPWLAAIIAILELVLGFAMLSFPYILGASAVWVAGFVFVVVGILHFIHVFTRSGNRWWNLLSALIFAVIGTMLLSQTAESMVAITLAIGCALLAGGIMRLIVAFSMRGVPGNAWRFYNAAISLLLGGMVLWTWPESSQWLIGTVIAVEMIFSGWALIFLAFSQQRPCS